MMIRPFHWLIGIVTFLLIGISGSSFAQSVSGPTQVYEGSTYTYLCTGCTNTNNPGGVARWELSSASAGRISVGADATDVEVTWNQAGSFEVIVYIYDDARDINGNLLSNPYSLLVEVQASGAGSRKPPTPDASLLVNYNCNIATLSYTGTPPDGVTWYWQEIADGTSTTFSNVVNTSGTYYLRAKNATSWSDGAISTSVNFVGPATVAIDAINGALAIDKGPYQLNASVTNGVNGTGTWTGQGISASGEITSSSLECGTEIYTYRFQSVQGCVTEESVAIDFITQVNAGLPTTYSLSSSRIALRGSPLGGTWSGPGVNALGEIDPSQLDCSSYEYTYTVKGCSNTVMHTFELPPAELQSDPLELCAGSSDYNLNATIISGPLNGAWSGTGVSVAGVLSVDELSIGTYTYTYDIQVGSCIASSQMTVEIIGSETGDFAESNIVIGCDQVSGVLSLPNRVGEVTQWSKRYGTTTQWLVATDTDGNPNTLTFNETQPVTFRATVQNGSCSSVIAVSNSYVPEYVTPGTIAVTSGQINCGDGTFQLVSSGAVGTIVWQQRTGNGSFTDIAGATSTGLSQTVTEHTDFRLKVSSTTCAPEFSNIITVSPGSKSGVVSASNTAGCGSVSGSLSVSGQRGTIVRWEHMLESMTKFGMIEGSAGKSIINYTASESGYYRVVVQAQSCVEVESEAVYIKVDQPTQEGTLIQVGSERYEKIGDEATLFVTFDLENVIGDVVYWEKRYEDGTSEQVSYDLLSEIPFTQLTWISPFVQNGSCAGRFSGTAFVPVNKTYQGSRSTQEGGESLNSYEGYDYEVGDELSLQDGFSFHANSAQSFSVKINNQFSTPHERYNYTLEETILKEGITAEADLFFLNADEKTATYSYMDGLGRPLQSVSWRSSPNQKDMVVGVAYDEKGRTHRQYLPYVSEEGTGYYRENWLTETEAFYQQEDDKIANTTVPYAETVYDETPRNRTVEQGAVGEQWQPGSGHATTYDYFYNSANQVMDWRINPDTDLPVLARYYPANYLAGQQVTDANGRKVRSFSGSFGQVVTQVQDGNGWLETYTIYNDLGLVRYTLPPEAVGRIKEGETVDQDFLDRWAFQVKYDERKRPIASKDPGVGWSRMIYDQWDRIILTQDANQAAKGKWIYTKYDYRDRPIIIGEYYTSESIASLEERVNNYQIKPYEELDVIEDHHYTLNKSFPLDAEVNLVLTANYYDSYAFRGSWDLEIFGYEPVYTSSQPTEYNTKIDGLATGSKTRILNESRWLGTVTYYDERYRTIATIAEGYKGYIRSDYDLDYQGRTLAVRESFHYSTEITTIEEEYVYDHASRVIAQYHQINDQPKVLMNEYAYNELGELVEQNMHLQTAGTYLQSLDYRYNIRGWMTHINNPELVADGVTNDDVTDRFGMELIYTDPITVGSETVPGRFNGDISGMRWQTKDLSDVSTREQLYAYRYDDADRLSKALYANRLTGGFNWNSHVGYYDVAVSGYDRNGNIQGIKRNSAGSLVDDLDYTYVGNFLTQVADQAGEEVFRDAYRATGDEPEYEYDFNGNMTRDANKLISSMTYNLMDLQDEVIIDGKGTVRYIYDAAGIKLAKIYTDNHGQTHEVDYLGALEFVNDAVEVIHTPEGRAASDLRPGHAGEYIYEYFLKDHQGNIRAIVTSGVPDEIAFTLDMEDADDPFYINDAETRQEDVLYNHTENGRYSARLNASQGRVIGPGIMLQVVPGDTVRMSAYARYIPTGDDYTGLVANIFGTLSEVTAQSSEQISSNLANALAGLPALGLDGNTDAPQAYLNYLFFSESISFDPDASDFQQITSTAATEWEQLSLETIIDRPGFIYVYVANETEADVNVFFDDIRVSTRGGALLEANDFYPFGEPLATSWRQPTYLRQVSLYQGLYTDYDSIVGQYEFLSRTYDPILGRFMQVDPEQQFSSPFIGMGNMPMIGVDPNGKLVFIPILVGAAIGGIINVGIQAFSGNIQEPLDAFAAFGIGALAGAVAVAAPQLIGTVGNIALTTSAGTIATGFVPGAIAGASGGFVSGFGNAAYFQDASFKEALGQGFIGAGVGALTGGTIGGLQALGPKSTTNFWGKSNIKTNYPTPPSMTSKGVSLNNESPKVPGLERSNIITNTDRQLPMHSNLTQGNTRMGLDHINLRHFEYAGAENVSRFSSDIGARQIRDIIQSSLNDPSRIITQQGSKIIVESSVGRVIGSTQSGSLTTWIRTVFSSDGTVITSYPIPNPFL